MPIKALFTLPVTNASPGAGSKPGRNRFPSLPGASEDPAFDRVMPNVDYWPACLAPSLKEGKSVLDQRPSSIGAAMAGRRTRAACRSGRSTAWFQSIVLAHNAFS